MNASTERDNDHAAQENERDRTGLEQQRVTIRLVTAIQELSLARDLASVMRVVRRAARELAQADGATFVLHEGDHCYYAEEDAISPLWKGRRFSIETCI